jgi:hypothetical protein
MKKTIVILACLFCSAAGAVVISWTVNTAMGLRLKNAYQGMAGSSVRLEMGERNSDGFGRLSFTMPIQDPNEEDAAFAKRSIGYVITRFMVLQETIDRRQQVATIATEAVADANLPAVVDVNTIE